MRNLVGSLHCAEQWFPAICPHETERYLLLYTRCGVVADASGLGDARRMAMTEPDSRPMVMFVRPARGVPPVDELLTTCRRFDVTAERALARARSSWPHLYLLTLREAARDTVALWHALRRMDPRTPIVFLRTSPRNPSAVAYPGAEDEMMVHWPEESDRLRPVIDRLIARSAARSAAAAAEVEAMIVPEAVGRLHATRHGTRIAATARFAAMENDLRAQAFIEFTHCEGAPAYFDAWWSRTIERIRRAAGVGD